jgi:hypothetical protein
MVRLFRQSEFQPQDLRDLGELADRGVRLAVFEVGQTTQRDPGELGKVTLTKAEFVPPSNSWTAWRIYRWIMSANFIRN